MNQFDPTLPEWRAIFPAKLTARRTDTDTGIYLYSWEEVIQGGDGTYTKAVPGRFGKCGDGTTSNPVQNAAREVNNAAVTADDTTQPIVWMRVRGQRGSGDVVYEFNNGGLAALANINLLKIASYEMDANGFFLAYVMSWNGTAFVVPDGLPAKVILFESDGRRLLKDRLGVYMPTIDREPITNTYVLARKIGTTTWTEGDGFTLDLYAAILSGFTAVGEHNYHVDQQTGPTTHINVGTVHYDSRAGLQVRYPISGYDPAYATYAGTNCVTVTQIPASTTANGYMSTDTQSFAGRKIFEWIESPIVQASYAAAVDYMAWQPVSGIFSYAKKPANQNMPLIASMSVRARYCVANAEVSANSTDGGFAICSGDGTLHVGQNATISYRKSDNTNGTLTFVGGILVNAT